MTTFTTISGNTFTTNEQGNYFYMIDTNGKKIRIKKSEFEAAQRENEIEREMSKPEDVDPNDPENAYPTEEQTAEAEQAELDKDPCIVDPMADLQKPAVIDENGCVDCRECNIKECVHRNCMRRNPKSIGGLAECPRLKVKAEEEEAKDPEIEQIEEEIPGIEDAEAELERNIRKEKKAKKAAKPRRSKDVGFEYKENGETLVTLTAKQADFILHIADTDFWTGDYGNGIFVDVLCDQIGGQFEGKPMTVGAMISTLCEKGLGERCRDTSRQGKPIVFGFTALGVKVAMAVGLK